jgi:hypothetical protein
LRLPSSLCLDAPFVALGWALLLSPVPAAGRNGALAALFLTVWTVYLADRLFDSLRHGKAATVPSRHEWARSHRGWLLVLLLTATVGAALTIPAVPSRTLRPGWILAAATGIYFLVFRGSRIHRRLAGVFPAKELVIGTVFAFGVLLAARGSAGLDSAPALLGAMTLLFTGNCLLIARTEAVSDRTRDEAAYFSGTGSCHHLPEGFLAASAGLALVLDPSIHEIGTLAVAISAGATLAVSRIRRGEVPQALADALLLSPWILLPWRGAP